MPEVCLKQMHQWKSIGFTELLLKCSRIKERKTPTLYIDHLLKKHKPKPLRNFELQPHHVELLRFLLGPANISEVFFAEIVNQCTRYPSVFDQADTLKLFLDDCVRLYERSTIHPGTPVGVIAVQSFSERLTQATLNR